MTSETLLNVNHQVGLEETGRPHGESVALWASPAAPAISALLSLKHRLRWEQKGELNPRSPLACLQLPSVSCKDTLHPRRAGEGPLGSPQADFLDPHQLPTSGNLEKQSCAWIGRQMHQGPSLLSWCPSPTPPGC